MIIDASTKLEIVLGGAVAANALEVNICYVDYNASGILTKPGITRTTSNNTTDVTILAAPTTSFVRELRNGFIYNKDTASATVTVKTDNSTTERIVCKATLATLECLMYEHYEGWFVLTASGARKIGGVSVPGSSTDNAVVRWDGATGTSIQNSGVVIDDSNNVTGILNLTITGNATLGDQASDTITLTGTVISNVIFTDNTYDIGASGATRPKDGFFSGKLVVSGSSGNAMGIATSSSTILALAAGTTGVSSLRIPHGSAPTSPVDGDMWTTAAGGLFVRINGVTVGPLT